MRLLGMWAIFFIAVVALGCVIVQTPSPETPTIESIEENQSEVSKIHSEVSPTETINSSTESPQVESTNTPIPTNIEFSVPAPDVTPLHSGPSIAELVEMLRPSVVHLTNAGASRGSGVLISPNGLVATNAHVADCCESFTAVVDGRQYHATVIAIDDSVDLALVLIDSTQLFESARFADPQNVIVGDEVIALGFPMHLGHDLTATKGIISAYRHLRGSEFIQHDAAINPGNSGGPLINLDGKVVGINTSSLRDAEGIGFALSVREIGNRLSALASGQYSPRQNPTPTAYNRPTPTPHPTVRPTPTSRPGPTSTPSFRHGIYQQVEIAFWHACALKNDNRIECWGDNSKGQSDPPSGKFKQIAVGNRHGCALDFEGRTTCWGSNESFSGEIRGHHYEGIYLGQANPPDDQFVSITAASIGSNQELQG